MSGFTALIAAVTALVVALATLLETYRQTRMLRSNRVLLVECHQDMVARAHAAGRAQGIAEERARQLAGEGK